MTFSVGNVLGDSLRIWFKNLIPFTLLSLAVHIPLFVYTWMVIGHIETSADPEATIKVWSWVAAAARVVLGSIVSGTLIYGVVEELRGAHPSFGDSVRFGLSRMGPVIATGVVTSLAILLGCCLLLIPGLVAACAFYVAVPAAVCERLGVGEAMNRSGTLTGGHRWPIFGIVVLIAALNRGAGYVLQPLLIDSLEGLKTFAMVAVGVDVLFGSFAAVCAAVAYATLRQGREGTDAEELARVFT